MAFNTTASEHTDSRAVSIYVLFDFTPSEISDPINIRQTIGESFYIQWVDLDHLLAQLYESHAVRAKAVAMEERVCTCIGELLPEATKGGCTVLVYNPDF